MWRLFDTESNSQSRAGGGVEKVLADAEILFGKSQERYLFRLASIRRIKETPDYNTESGRGKV